MQRNFSRDQVRVFVCFFKPHSPWVNSTLSSHLLLVEQDGRISKEQGPNLWCQGELSPSLNAESHAEPPAVSLLESCSLGSGMVLCLSCLIAIWVYALQFSLVPLMLFNKFSQSSRTKWEGKQLFHMKKRAAKPRWGFLLRCSPVRLGSHSPSKHCEELPQMKFTAL